MLFKLRDKLYIILKKIERTDPHYIGSDYLSFYVISNNRKYFLDIFIKNKGSKNKGSNMYTTGERSISFIASDQFVQFLKKNFK